MPGNDTRNPPLTSTFSFVMANFFPHWKYWHQGWSRGQEACRAEEPIHEYIVKNVKIAHYIFALRVTTIACPAASSRKSIFPPQRSMANPRTSRACGSDGSR